MRRVNTERGSVLAIVALVTAILAGLALITLRQSRSELLGSGTERVSQQAYQAAHAGLYKFLQAAAKDYRGINRAAFAPVANQTTTATRYVFAADNVVTDVPGMMQLDGPFPANDSMAAYTGDAYRVGRAEFQVVIRDPRLAASPPGNQMSGISRYDASAPMSAFQVWQFDAYGYVNRELNTTGVPLGGGGAKKHLCGEVMFGSGR